MTNSAGERYDEYMRQLKRKHKIKVKALGPLKALVPGDHPTLQALESAPEYVCTCGEFFDTLEEAKSQIAEAEVP